VESGRAVLVQIPGRSFRIRGYRLGCLIVSGGCLSDGLTTVGNLVLVLMLHDLRLDEHQVNLSLHDGRPTPNVFLTINLVGSGQGAERVQIRPFLASGFGDQAAAFNT
jgi:hypothetical protein